MAETWARVPSVKIGTAFGSITGDWRVGWSVVALRDGCVVALRRVPDPLLEGVAVAVPSRSGLGQEAIKCLVGAIVAFDHLHLHARAQFPFPSAEAVRAIVLDVACFGRPVEQVVPLGAKLFDGLHIVLHRAVRAGWLGMARRGEGGEVQDRSGHEYRPTCHSSGFLQIAADSSSGLPNEIMAAASLEHFPV